MTDLEITKLCAEAMGYFRPQNSQHVRNDFNGVWVSLHEHDPDDNKGVILFRPLKDDAQAMALVKKFGFDIRCMSNWWGVGGQGAQWCYGADINRCVCECVAKMQSEKRK